MVQGKRILTFLLITAGFLFGSCSVKQHVFIETDSSGSMSLRIELNKVLIEYLKELAELTGEPIEGDIFNVDKIKSEIPEDSRVELKRIQTPAPEILEIDMAFNRIEDLFAGDNQLRSAGILSFNRVSEGYSLRIYLDHDNFSQIPELFPFLQNPLFEGLGPQENDNTTEDEYLELIELAMGEDGASALKASYFNIQVKVRGKILTQSGGTISRGGVNFRIPLIRVLLLDKPLEYSIVFK